MSIQPERIISGKYIIEEGKVLENLIILVRGEVIVEKNGKEVARIDEQNTFLGEISYLLQTPSTASVKSAGFCQILKIPANKAENFFAQSPKMALTMCKVLAKRLNETTAKMLDSSEQPADTPRENKSPLPIRRGSEAAKLTDEDIEQLKTSLDTFFGVCLEIAEEEKLSSLKNVVDIAQSNVKNILG